MIREFSFKQQITEDIFDSFAKLSEDTNPVHFDSTVAKNLGFKAPIVHGMVNAAFISKLIGTKIPGPGSVWLSQTINFIQPVYINDTLDIAGKLVSYSTVQKVSKINIEIKNQNGDVVLRGTAVVKKSFDEEKDIEQTIKNAKVFNYANSETKINSYLITGGTGGIGQAVIRKLIHPNNKIHFTFKNDKESAKSLVDEVIGEGGWAKAYYMDLKDSKSISEMFLEIESSGELINGVVHCSATLADYKKFESFNSNELIEKINDDLCGAIQLLHSSVMNFQNLGSGSFVNVSTLYTQSAPPVGMYSYIASKSALESIIDGLAYELGPMGVRFNSVLPGMTQTNFLDKVPEKSKLVTKATTPLRKLGQPFEIANLICFLLAEDSSHITGEKYRISGGLR
jgi:3-oxoacyl-[acyl-carrier protein] reductase